MAKRPAGGGRGDGRLQLLEVGKIGQQRQAARRRDKGERMMTDDGRALVTMSHALLERALEAAA